MNSMLSVLLTGQFIADYFLFLGNVLLLLNIQRKCTYKSVSAKTQILFTIIFTIRYADLLFSYMAVYENLINQQSVITLYIFLYNFIKFAHIIIMYWTLFMIYLLFEKSTCRKYDTIRMDYLIVPCGILSLLMNYKFELAEILWSFSFYLEAVAAVPQMQLFSKAKNAGSIIFYYIIFVTLYKACYMTNWIYSSYYLDSRFDKIAFACGTIQLISYYDFVLSNLSLFSPKNGTILKNYMHHGSDNI